MCEKKNNQNKIDALTDNMISCMKIHEESDKKLVKRIRLMPEIKKNYDFVAKDETSIEANYFCDGFVEGANWRIDSVWHEGSEKPDTDKGDLLIIVKDAFGKDVYVRQNAYYVLKYGCKKWAYIKDLIPNMED